MDIDKAFEELYEGWKKGKYKVTDGKTGKVLGRFNSGGKAQKYVDDIFQKGDYYPENPSIGRVVVSKKERGKEIGKSIMKQSILYIKNNHNSKSIELSAQKYLDKFYKELGFYAKGKEYLEDGIPHQRMFFDLV